MPNPHKEEISQHKDLVRDKKDIPIALAVINAKVDYLVNNDKDLTDRDQSTEELRKYVLGQTLIIISVLSFIWNLYEML